MGEDSSESWDREDPQRTSSVLVRMGSYKKGRPDRGHVWPRPAAESLSCHAQGGETGAGQSCRRMTSYLLQQPFYKREMHGWINKPRSGARGRPSLVIVNKVLLGHIHVSQHQCAE